MVRQWKNEILGVNYFYLSSKNGNAVLTSDGVLIPYNQFKNITPNEYNEMKVTNGGYNYATSCKIGKLVKNNNVTEEPIVKRTHSSFDMDENKEEKIIEPKEEIKDEIKEMEETEVHVEPAAVKKNVPVKTTRKQTRKSSFNMFDFFYPKIMICLTIICSLLSIYFTATYLQRLQDIVIAYAISTSMLLFDIIGFQMARRAKRNNKFSQFIIYFVTSFLVILFSMLSSIDVNYSKYKLSHKTIETEYNLTSGKKVSYKLLENELEDNKKQIENLNNDIEFQQTQWVMSWDSEKGKNVLIEGKITSVAQEKITEDKNQILELQKRNKEINEILISYAQEGTDAYNEKSDATDEALTLTDLLGSIMNVSGNVIQLIFLLVPSFFIDIINIMSVSIYCDFCEEKEKKF